jgi:hypothetical protein
MDSRNVDAISRSLDPARIPSLRLCRAILWSGFASIVASAAVLRWWNEPPNILMIAGGAIALVAIAASHFPGWFGLPDDFARIAEPAAAVAVLIGSFCFYAATMFQPSPFNEQLRQAVAFIHGHTYIDAPQSFLEHAQVGAYSYALHPPLPAILLIPFAAIWGMDANQGTLSVELGAIAIMAAWMMLGRMRLRVEPRIWLTIFFACGTIFWFETTVGTTWALPMVTAVVFIFLALDELFGEARPVGLGIYLGLACLARYDVALAVPVIAYLAWREGRTIRELLWMAPGFIAAGMFFVAYNEARYGTLFDIGVQLTGPKDAPAFALGYIPGNLYTILFMAPTINGTFPYFHPIFGGQAIALTSPAFALALRARVRRPLTIAMAACAFLVSIPSLLCYANGFAQFGTRHYIPAFPFLLVMMALGTRRQADQLTRALICISIFLVAFGLFQVRVIGWSS